MSTTGSSGASACQIPIAWAGTTSRTALATRVRIYYDLDTLCAQSGHTIEAVRAAADGIRAMMSARPAA